MKAWKTVLLALATAVTASVFAAPAGAVSLTATLPPGTQLDQSSMATDVPSYGFVSRAHEAASSQTFTAGMSGSLQAVVLPLLNRPFEFLLGQGFELEVGIHPTSFPGEPDTSVELASATVPGSSLPYREPAWVVFVFEAPAELVAGTEYAITLSELGEGWDIDFWDNHIFWAGSSSDTYAGGSPSGDLRYQGGDLAFQTYMLPGAPKESNRAGYCSAPGNSRADGTPIPAGTFLDLAVDQAHDDPHYAGATPAYYLQGLGITCTLLPGYRATGETVGYHGHGDAGTYLYYAKNG